MMKKIVFAALLWMSGAAVCGAAVPQEDRPEAAASGAVQTLPAAPAVQPGGQTGDPVLPGRSGKEYKAARKWAERLFKRNGIGLPLHPSTDFVQLRRQAEADPELWKLVLNELRAVDPTLGGYALGKRELAGERCNINITEYQPKASDAVRLEGHERFLDIQISTGDVMWGVYPAGGPDLVTLAQYNPKSDNGFYKSDRTVYFRQQASRPCIFIFFPDDLHIPSFAPAGKTYPEKLKKLVVKVEMMK